MKKVSLITDGSCLGNPGPGGWACILRFGAVKKELFGYDPNTTNNRMELMAAIQGLLAFKEPCEVEITTDAEYVRQGITEWIIRWKRRYWWKKNQPVRNADLWIELDELAGTHKRIGSGPKVTPATRTTTGATGWLRMLLGRRRVPGPMAARTGASVMSWDATTFHRSRRLICSMLWIWKKTMKRSTPARIASPGRGGRLE